MGVKLVDYNKFIRDNKVLQVTSPNLFTAMGTPDPNGLVSTVIFGMSTIDRQSMFGYIDLGEKFIAPLVYKRIFKRSFRAIDGIIAGVDKYSINSKGELVPDANGGTGLPWLYKNFEKIKFKNIHVEKDEESDEDLSLFKEDVVAIMKKYDKDILFTDKILVIPIAFRDVDIRDGMMGIDELNTLYRSIMNKAKILKENKNVSLFDTDRLRFQIQLQLASALDHYKGILFGKHGVQRKRALSKNVDYGSIVVLSAHEMDGDKFEDDRVNVDKTGFPLSAIIANMGLFINTKIKSYLISLPMKDARGNPIMLRDKELYYDGEKIKEYTDIYLHSVSERFNVVETPKGNPLMFTYKDSSRTVTREMTITDLLYRFAYLEAEVAERHMMITRHPTMDSFNIIPTLIHVLSTIKWKKIIIDEQEFPYYPDIEYILKKYDLKDPKDAIRAEKEMSGYFVESEKMSNLQFKGMNADLDGDKNIARPVFSDEGNEECREKRKAIISFFDMKLDNMKMLGNDSTQAMYSFSTFSDDFKYVSDKVFDKIEHKPASEITISFLFKDLKIANLTNAKKENDIHDRIKFKLPNYGLKGTGYAECTLGQFIIWKLLFEEAGIPLNLGPYTKKVLESSFSKMGSMIKDGTLDIELYKRIVNRYELFSLRMSSFINPSLPVDIMVLPQEVKDLKKKVMEENREGIEANDPVAAAKVEKAVLDKIKEINKGKAGMELFDSGVVSFDNQFKTMFVMAGAMPQDPDFKKFKVVTNSLSEGLEKKDLSYASNTGLVGGYSKGKEPEVGGAMAKMIGYVYQTMRIDKYGTDCHTKTYADIFIPSGKKDQYEGRYIVDGDKEILLTNENIDRYAGMTVKMRSVLTCKNPLVCSKCAGETIYKMYNVYDAPIDIGLKLSKQQHELVQKRMKLSHDVSVKFKHLNVDTFLESTKNKK